MTPGQHDPRSSEPRFWPAIILIALAAAVSAGAAAMLQAWVSHLGLTWGLG